MELIICIVLPLFLIIGIWLAKGTQDFIDEQNARIREDRKNDTTNTRTLWTSWQEQS